MLRLGWMLDHGATLQLCIESLISVINQLSLKWTGPL